MFMSFVTLQCTLAITFAFMQEITCIGLTNDNIINKFIQSGYRKEVRPRCPDEPAVDVTIDLALRQIIEVNEPKQILQTNVWLRVNWRDCRLSWNETEYGQSQIVLPASFLWIPDVTLYDNADEGMNRVSKEYRIIITSSGEARHQIPVVLNSLCKIDTTHFPFDRQQCPLTFGMWSYNGNQVNLTNSKQTGDLGNYQGHVEWKLNALLSIRKETIFNDMPYPAVTYMLQLERKPLFFILNLFFPCVLISLVAILGFLLPPDSGEKVNLEITVLLSLAVFQLIVLEMMPPSSETLPYISIYFAVTMTLVGLSCFMTVVVLNIHFKGHQGWRPPHLVMQLFVRGLGGILCVKDSQGSKSDRQSSSPYPMKRLSAKIATNGIGNNISTIVMQDGTGSTDINGVSDVNTDTNAELNREDHEVGASSETIMLLRHFKNINERLNIITSRLNQFQHDRSVCHDWHLLAQVLDRTFMIVYGVASLISIVTFMVKFLNQ